MRVELSSKTILLDGEPTLVLAGEIHYFRVPRTEWSARLDLLLEAGANTVASYIPWVVHEDAAGDLDLDGHRVAELDLGAFIDLCRDRGLLFLARPGPFVMAELRHEGIPGRLVQQYPSLRSVGWDGVPAPTAAVDYLAPDFLREVGRWYHAVGEVLAPRMADIGGPVIAVQLDNEVGMLAWVSNSPDLTDRALQAFHTDLTRRYGAGFASRYPGAPVAADPSWPPAVRSPVPAWAAPLRIDLARFYRQRFAVYIAVLRDLAVRNGFGEVPLLINIHGTGNNGAVTFPIGISQLVDTYRGVAGMASGSDHYLGTLSWESAGDLHMVHAFLDAVNGPDQPLTSLEFEAGTGDYGSDAGNLADPTAVVLKTRILLAQETRLFNWYLFTGGENFIDPRPDDNGTHRFGITGQRHGNAAPVTPEGTRGPAFASTAEAIQLAAAHRRWASRWRQETDSLAVGFVLDHFATEYSYSGNAVMPAMVAELSWARGGGPRSLLPRMLLGAGFRYGAVDLQSPLVEPPQVIALGSPTLLAAEVQQRLVDFVGAGGGLLLLGALPTHDDDGVPCTVLADALGLRVSGTVDTGFPSVIGDGWAAGQPETRVGRMQFLERSAGQVLLRDAMTGAPCGAQVPLGNGRVTVIATDYGAHPAFYRRALAELGAVPGLQHTSDLPGLFTTTTVTPDDDRFLHVVNVTGYQHTARFTLDGAPLFGGTPLSIGPRSGLILPIGVQVGVHRIDSSTAEIIRCTDDVVVFQVRRPDDVIVLDGRVLAHAGPGVISAPLS